MGVVKTGGGKGLLAGAGRSAVELPAGTLPLDGFTVEHDPLYVRVLALDGDGGKMALAVVDQISLSTRLVADLKALLTEICEIPADWAVVCASHTFGAPHIHAPVDAASGSERANGLAYDALIAAVREAAQAANDQLRPARMGTSAGTSKVNVNRDVATADGWWLGADETGPVDRGVTVLRFEDLDGQPIGLLVNYAMQSSITHESEGLDRGKIVTSDIAGAAMRHVERLYDDEPVALFLVGAAGDQSPYLTSRRLVLDRNRSGKIVDVHESGFLLVEMLGERLGAEVVRVSETVECVAEVAPLGLAATSVALPGQVPPANFRELRPSTSYEFKRAADSEASLLVLRIGDVGFVGVEVELSCSIGLAIKQTSPFTHTLVTTMVNGGDKYMVDTSGYDRITYGAMNSRYGRGAAEAFAVHIEGALHDLQQAASGAMRAALSEA